MVGEELVSFLSYFDETYMDRSRPKGPDYLIIDDFADFFHYKEDSLLKARKYLGELYFLKKLLG